jgi:hypothetical protein
MRDKPRYVIGTGFHSNPGPQGDALAWFYSKIWLANTAAHSTPQTIYVLATGEGKRPPMEGETTVWIELYGDLGHCGDLLSGKKNYHFGGWTMTMLTGAMMAYQCEADFIFKEQDTLAFGPWVERMYEEIGPRGCIFGSCRLMGAANSLMLIRHAFIPEFVRLYLGTGPETNEANLGEKKIAKLQADYPAKFCRFSFGFDRDRPLDLKAPVWYGQKFTAAELWQIRDAGLIAFDAMPDECQKFTNA